ncbi:M13 family metallopeptidase [Alteriqipengyuania lutimaris]|uniref:M13 family peptidase n=1 Tax=Alteriqipengyuania lutimaris TaxID=1538146 RepID=A0A395LJL9_9SPHN|nr:M13 family metallopeptidase [Alteriqipengyuania lutimaris]MBB3034180.1 putative endopeptidase [Alteriqipengyuania lutimaris]RDS76895.1 M13 family peptidase [Alteriqipengyuania lutimaris]
MIRTILATTASAVALSLAAPALAHDHAAGETEFLLQDGAADEGAAQTPTMSFGEWGVDTALLSDSIDPGDDFFAYVNQEWLDANPLPPEYSRFGAFNLLREKSTSDVKTLVDSLLAKPASQLTGDEKRIVDAYNSYYDTDAIDAAGLAQAQPYLDKIRDAGTLAELATLWGTPGYSSPLGGGVNVDSKEPTRYSVYIGSGGLGLPDRDYYLDESEKGREIQAKYREYLTFLMTEAGYDDPAAMAQSVYDFEDQIARTVSWDRATRRNRDLTYNALTPVELGELSGAFPLTALLTASGFAETDRFIVGDLPPSLEEVEELGLTQETLDKIGGGTPAMMALIADTPVEMLQAWTIKEFLENNASVLPSRFDEADFEFYGKTLQGTPEQRPRWKRAIGESEGLLGELLGKSYAAEYFPAENKAAMEELVANLRVALRESIGDIDWMGEETKEEALAKLDAFDPKIGYRDNLETYEGLEITPGDPIANRMAAARWQWQDSLSKLGGPIDRTEWFMLPQTVNAYYNPTKNEIVFPAAILQQPFFALTNDPAVNYGGIGGVIGHEMGHGFDDQGSKSDGTGMLRNWWTDADRAAFDERGNALVEQYNGFCPLGDGETCVNGRLTLGENIGDLGGLSLAYRAYKLSLNGKEDKVIDGLTGDQRFFLAWAQVWRSQQREEAARQRLLTDPHSPEEFRVNGVVRNMDAWYEAFNVTPQDDLYLPPEERISIW